MERLMFRAARAAAVVLAISLGVSGMARADVYLSLGDSLAFGETVFQNNPALGAYSDPSLGDRGYVGMYADYLAAQNGGTRPTVVNLAIDGERLGSFASGVGRVPPQAGISDTTLAQFNLNYAGATPPTQSTLLGATLAAKGSSITNITISLGSNDLFALALTDPNAAADLPGALAQFKAGYESLVNGLHAGAPNATIYLLGSYNPFTADPSSPFAALAAVAIPMLETTIGQVAADTGALFVPIFNSPLTNDAANYTLILQQDDVHPAFDKGYAVIAGAIEAVPEPSAFALAAVGIAGLVVAGRARRRVAVTS